MNLLRALAATSSMTLLSRILGFVRDALIAHLFGAGMYTDAFFVAFRIPNLLRRLFAEGAFSQAFVPILAEYKARRGTEATRDLVDHVATVLALALVAVTAAGVVGAGAVVWISAPGFSADPAKFGATTAMLRVTFPYILFISLTALAAGILNTHGRFTVPAFTPVLLNLSFIGFSLAANRWFHPPAMALAWGALVGGALQLAFQVPFLLRVGMLPRPRLDVRDPGVWRVLRQMGPAVLGVSIGQVSLLVSTIFASFLASGSVSWLFYADRLMEFPTGLLGAALGTILLPSLARSYADADTAEYSRLLDWGLRLTLLLTLPAAIALAELSVPLIATLFKRGAFKISDVWMVRQALLAYSVGLVGLIVVKILAPGFYARQDIRTPVKIGIATLAATQLMNLAFVLPLKHAGLALATGLGASLNALALYVVLRRRAIYRPVPGWGGYLARLAAAGTVMAIVLYVAMGGAQWWMDARLAERIGRLAALIVGGASAYFGTLWLCGLRLAEFSKRTKA